ncbi:MAG: arsenate reductase ArsC [bacterium]|nr:arsenate reductase ArsC [bacterium]
MNKVLFICAENAGRSQMSEAFFNHYNKSTEWSAESYGTMPAKEINRRVAEAMKELGIDIGNKSPALFDPSTVESYDRIISYGCLVKGLFSSAVQAKIEEWSVNNPKDKSIEEVRKIRDEIKEKVLTLLKEVSL